MRDVLAIVFDAPSWEEAVAGDTGGDSTAHRTGAGLLSRLLTAAVPVCVLAHSDAVADTVHEWTAANGVTSPAVTCIRYTSDTAAVEALETHVRSRLHLEPANVADSFAAPGFCSVRLGTPPCDLLPAGHPPLQQVTLSDIPLLLARRLGAAVAGYTLTAKRERSLLASALLPPLPRHGLCATPIALPARGDPPHVLEQSLRRCDVIMHKATDQLAAPEVMPIAGRLAIAPEVEALLACAAREGMPVLDPPRLLATVFDRVAIAAVLARMPPLLGGVPTRGPTTAEVQALDPGHVAAALAGAGITLPCLLKPRVACGTPKSHHFALLTSTSGAPAACVDVPAVAQAFVRHDGTAHKVYCFADQVLTQQRRSLPAVDAASPGVAGVVSFDALHALPTSWGPPSDNASDSGGAATAADAPSAPLLSMEAVHAMAAWLRRETGLSLFGFDVLVEAHTGAHLVVDLNYFPSATGVDGAPQALASAVSAAAQRLP